MWGRWAQARARNDAIDSINGPAFDPCRSDVDQRRRGVRARGPAECRGVGAAALQRAGDVWCFHRRRWKIRPPMLSGIGVRLEREQPSRSGSACPTISAFRPSPRSPSGIRGYLVVTGMLTPDQRSRLTKYFLQILANITNANIITDPAGELHPGEEHRIPFHVTEAEYGLDAFVLTPFPEAIDYALETPGGARIDAGSFAGLGKPGARPKRGRLLPGRASGNSGGRRRVPRRHLACGAEARSRPGAAGEAHFRLAAAENPVPYAFVAQCFSNLAFKAWLGQRSFQPGDGVRLLASLREYDAPARGRVTMWAEVQCPDGRQLDIRMEPADDLYAASFDTSLPGGTVCGARAGAGRNPARRLLHARADPDRDRRRGGQRRPGRKAGRGGGAGRREARRRDVRVRPPLADAAPSPSAADPGAAALAADSEIGLGLPAAGVGKAVAFTKGCRKPVLEPSMGLA